MIRLGRHSWRCFRRKSKESSFLKRAGSCLTLLSDSSRLSSNSTGRVCFVGLSKDSKLSTTIVAVRPRANGTDLRGGALRFEVHLILRLPLRASGSSSELRASTQPYLDILKPKFCNSLLLYVPWTDGGAVE